jgi:hypothetical protein
MRHGLVSSGNPNCLALPSHEYFMGRPPGPRRLPLNHSPVHPLTRFRTRPHEMFRLVIKYVMHDTRGSVAASVNRCPRANTWMFNTTGGNHRQDVGLHSRRTIASRVDFQRGCTSAAAPSGRLCGRRALYSTRRQDGRGYADLSRLGRAASGGDCCQHSAQPDSNTTHWN